MITYRESILKWIEETNDPEELERLFMLLHEEEAAEALVSDEEIAEDAVCENAFDDGDWWADCWQAQWD